MPLWKLSIATEMKPRCRWKLQSVHFITCEWAVYSGSSATWLELDKSNDKDLYETMISRIFSLFSEYGTQTTACELKRREHFVYLNYSMNTFYTRSSIAHWKLAKLLDFM